ncbi:hypothetical protein BST65_02530 [Bradyrhizobium canariense]|nr:hypothetical protein BST65_02530 [Bradyrhizobium canariense]OSI36899.1 hypothetical protein BST66_05135 [Bradyrhizobium canariense]OSI50927.1 hypothetical protein BSZ20_05215 [Bradyrhizobium canariense]OSI56931.1 hypothetical protein BST67_02685 [Bradyrhizobium canariense]OSI59645.1 hypothetical protein BSZ15_03720 [Bradyrhizobium canariense]
MSFNRKRAQWIDRFAAHRCQLYAGQPCCMRPSRLPLLAYAPAFYPLNEARETAILVDLDSNDVSVPYSAIISSLTLKSRI